MEASRLGSIGDASVLMVLELELRLLLRPLLLVRVEESVDEVPDELRFCSILILRNDALHIVFFLMVL